MHLSHSIIEFRSKSISTKQEFLNEKTVDARKDKGCEIKDARNCNQSLIHDELKKFWKEFD